MRVSVAQIVLPLRVEIDHMKPARCIDGAHFGVRHQLEAAVKQLRVDPAQDVGARLRRQRVPLHPRRREHDAVPPALDASPGRQGEVLHHGRDEDGRVVEQTRPELRVRTPQRFVRLQPLRQQLEALGEVALRRGSEAQARDVPRYVVASAHDGISSIAAASRRISLVTGLAALSVAAAHRRAPGDDAAEERGREIAIVAIGTLCMAAGCC